MKRLVITGLLVTSLQLLFAQNESLQISQTFMSEIKSFLIEEGFFPKIEDDYLNFKKEGVGYHLQVTGSGPYVYQFYVDGVELPTSMDLTRVLTDINNASLNGALIHSVYQQENGSMTILIRVAGATRSAEDFKYVFYTYLTGLQYGYSQALSYSNNPGKNYPNPKFLLGTQGLSIKNVYIGGGNTIIDFSFCDLSGNGNSIWISDKSYLQSKDNGEYYYLVKAEGISTNSNMRTPLAKNETINFRLVFPQIPDNTSKFDFFEGGSSVAGNPFSLFGVELQ